jgi:hypothetical protein
VGRDGQQFSLRDDKGGQCFHGCGQQQLRGGGQGVLGLGDGGKRADLHGLLSVQSAVIAGIALAKTALPFSVGQRWAWMNHMQHSSSRLPLPLYSRMDFIGWNIRRDKNGLETVKGAVQLNRCEPESTGRITNVIVFRIQARDSVMQAHDSVMQA